MKGFIFVHSDVDDAGLTPLQFRLLGHLSRRAGANGWIYSSIPNMAKICGCTSNTIKKGLRQLKDLNIVASDQRPGETALRRINPVSEWRVKPITKVTQVKNQPGSENGTAPSAEKMLAPRTKSAPERKSIEGNQLKNDPTPLPPKGGGEVCVLPVTLSTDEFKAAYRRWRLYRFQSDRPLTQQTERAVLAKCEEWGPDRSIQLIDLAIENSWKNLRDTLDYGPRRKIPPPPSKPALPEPPPEWVAQLKSIWNLIEKFPNPDSAQRMQIAGAIKKLPRVAWNGIRGEDYNLLSSYLKQPVLEPGMPSER